MQIDIDAKNVMNTSLFGSPSNNVKDVFFTPNIKNTGNNHDA